MRNGWLLASSGGGYSSRNTTEEVQEQERMNQQQGLQPDILTTQMERKMPFCLFPGNLITLQPSISQISCPYFA